MILDTTFLVDLERERRRGEDGPAVAFLKTHSADALWITFTIAGELAAGASLGADRAKWDQMLGIFPQLAWSNEIAWKFGRIYRELRAAGQLIGANDLWIAATAVAHGKHVVTRNESDFRRVPGLKVLGY